jgi:hypothetical protein
VSGTTTTTHGKNRLNLDAELPKKLGRAMEVLALDGDPGPGIVRVATEGRYDLVILSLPGEMAYGQARLDDSHSFVLRHSPCRVFLAGSPAIPQEVEEEPKGVS